MANIASFNVWESTEQYFANRGINQGQWTSKVNQAFNVLELMCDSLLPDFTHYQWSVLFKTYAKVDLHGYRDAMQSNSNISIATDVLEKHGTMNIDSLPFDEAHVVNVCFKLNFAQKYAVIDFLIRYFAIDHSQYQSFEQIKAAILSQEGI